MRTAALAAEMRQATALLRDMLGGDQVDDRLRAKCRAIGEIDASVIDICELIGIARAALDRERRLWRPAAASEPGMFAFITPALVDRPDTPVTPEPFFVARFGSLIDLVAWDPERPAWWALRSGAASWLGCADSAAVETPVWDCIADWLRADLAGLVILTGEVRERTRLLRLVPAPRFPALT